MSLEDIREKKNSVGVYVIIGLLLVGMAGFGTSQFGLVSGTSEQAALKAGKAEISLAAFQNAINLYRSRLPDLNNEQLESLVVRQLSERVALADYLNKHPLAADDATIDEAIRSNINFFENGQFSEAAFRRAVGTDPQTYRDGLSRDLALEEMGNSIEDSAIISQAELALYNARQNLTRDVTLVSLKAPELSEEAKAAISEAQMKSYYDAHIDNYQKPAEFEVQYLYLNPETLAENMPVSDDEIQAALVPKRDVTYFTFENAETANNFHNAMKELGTNDKIDTHQFAIKDGGTLEGLSAKADKTSPVPQSALDIIFAAPQGKVTAPIEIDGEYYGFMVNKIYDADTSDENKARIKAEIQKQKSQASFASTNEKLNHAVFETTSPTLESIAEAAELPIKTYKTGDTLPKEALDAIENSDKQIGKLQEPVSFNDSVFIYRINAYHAAESLPFDSVKEQVKTDLIAEETEKAKQQYFDDFVAKAKKEGLKKAAAEAGDKVIEINDFNLQKASDNKVDISAAVQILRAFPLPGDEHVTVVKGLSETYAYINNKVVLNDQAAKVTSQQASELALALGGLEYRSFLEGITKAAKVEVRSNLAAIEGATPQH